MRIGLVGCVKQKATTQLAAQDLYTSALFMGRRGWVEQTCERWFVLSALHGLVEPDQVIEPYDETLIGAGVAAKRAFARDLLEQLEEKLGTLKRYVFEIHAGNDYTAFGLADGLVAAGAVVENPAQGLGIGKQLAFYKGRPNRETSE